MIIILLLLSLLMKHEFSHYCCLFDAGSVNVFFARWSLGGRYCATDNLALSLCAWLACSLSMSRPSKCHRARDLSLLSGRFCISLFSRCFITSTSLHYRGKNVSYPLLAIAFLFCPDTSVFCEYKCFLIQPLHPQSWSILWHDARFTDRWFIHKEGAAARLRLHTSSL